MKNYTILAGKMAESCLQNLATLLHIAAALSNHTVRGGAAIARRNFCLPEKDGKFVQCRTRAQTEKVIFNTSSYFIPYIFACALLSISNWQFV